MTDIHNPLSVVVPYLFHSQSDFPTEIIAERFQAYRSIIKDLIAYLRQYASVQEEIVRQQVRLQQAVGASASAASSGHSAHPKGAERTTKDEVNLLNNFFLPIGNGSIQDIPTLLTKFHQQNIQNGTKTLKDINLVVIPKFEELRKDLLVKIKEIKNLQNDFKNSLGKEFLETKVLLSNFNHAVDYAHRLEVLTSGGDHHFESGSDTESAKNDPYLAKLKLNRQLRRQLSEENYLYEAFKNLQTSSEKLESIVVLEIQNYLRNFLNLVEMEHSTLTKFLIPNLTNGFLAKEPNFEWESFVNRNLPKSAHDPSLASRLIDLSFPARKVSDLNIPYYDSLVNVAIKEGPLERRSKFLKSYSSGWYVLTCSYLHEFKSSDRKKDQTPVMSLSLDYCLVSEHSKNDGKLSGAYKFALYSKLQNGLIHRGHNLAFRCDTYQSMIEWYNDIKTLTGLASPVARAKAMTKRLQTNSALNETKLSRTSTALSSRRSNYSESTNLNRHLSPKSTSRSVRSIAESHESNTSSFQNPRISSTFSQRYQQSPKLSNLINSDGTIVTPIVSNPDKSVTIDDENGDTLTHEPELKGDAHLELPPQPPYQSAPLVLPLQNGNYVGPTTPQQIIPQNYQYYVNLVNQQPQQFYDPVLQQFFTINPIPASQIPTELQQQQQQQAQQPQPQLQKTSSNPGQPMPQYFPSTQSSQIGPAVHLSPNLSAASPLLEQGHFAPAPNDSVVYKQPIPHLPQHLGESFAPYPVQFGDGIHGNSSQSSAYNHPVSDIQSQNKEKRESTIDQELPKLAINEPSA